MTHDHQLARLANNAQMMIITRNTITGMKNTGPVTNAVTALDDMLEFVTRVNNAKTPK